MGEPSKDRIGKVPKHQKSYFDVLGLCCSSEVPLIEKILKPLSGVQKVSVIVPSKTVIVVHDSLLISQHEILKALNQARLEATVRAYGSAEITKKWPSPYILACGVLLVVSLFKRFFHPLRWFAIAAVLVGINPIILRGIAAIRRLTLDINILLLIAGTPIPLSVCYAAVVIVAAGVALVPLVLRVNNPRIWFQLALVLLVSACPCALVLSTPVATFCALLKAARIGLLIKGGDVLEALAKIRVVAFDKTGTITKGEFKVVEFQSISSKVSLEMLLYWVSSIESKSSHPMAAALVEHARSHSIEPKPDCVKEFHIYPGEGIYGEVDGRDIHIGNKRIAARVLCETVPNMEDMKEGVTYGYVFLDMVPVGTYALSDTCRIGAAEAIKELKSLGIKTAMLTGDSMEASLHAQRQLNHVMEEVHAELLPEDKVQLIGKLKSREGSTAMVGDGMNDAPALAMADVGISMGVSGSAVAMETSHITLMSNDICKIPRAIRLARKTRRMIIMNIIFSGVTKIAILAIAFAGRPLLWAAVLADVGTCLLVILNSMTLLQTKTSPKNKCCGSSHKAHMEKPKHAEHCGCQDNHGCHDHRKAMDERRHSHCMNHDHPEESPAHARCCQELATKPTNSSQEHSITITDARHDSGDLQKQQDGPDSNMTCENQTLKCSSNNCNDKEKKRIEECCMGNRNDCGMQKGCSSSQGLIIERRELGGCCRTYTKACGSKDSCCASGRVQLPSLGAFPAPP